MPENIDLSDDVWNHEQRKWIRNSVPLLKPVATEDELQEFCNKVRQAGAADIVQALLLSIPGDPYSCLIARNLNFDCNVDGPDDLEAIVTRFPDRFVWVDKQERDARWADDKVSYIWTMNIPDSPELQQKIADELGLDNLGDDGIILPKEIGNAAEAFDKGRAFTQYDITADKQP